MQQGPDRVPPIRVRAVNCRPAVREGAYVLYWMTAYRRRGHNFALQHAVLRARELGKPLLVLEPLRAAYPWASDRHHAFLLQGMMENLRAFAQGRVRYYPFVERAPEEGKGLLEALAARACCVVTDDSPAFFLPRMLAAAAEKVPVALEAVDSNGLLPTRSAPGAFSTAHAFRRFLQKTLREHLGAFPAADPLAGMEVRLADVPGDILRRWPLVDARLFSGRPADLALLPIDHGVAPTPLAGGEMPARRAMESFVETRLHRYATERNLPEKDAASGLSPYLHFGHLSSHEVFEAVAEREGWSLEHLPMKATGSRSGWWGMSGSTEAFVDQLVTWRELGFNAAVHMPGWDRYESLPAWSLRTLEKHTPDRRLHLYTLEQFEGARTHDALWNAAQRQLVREGRVHNYLRMLWGKKILEWSPSPEAALENLVHLNDKYALDGRDPNSVSGIFWILGRYDRPWGPERPVFGTVRYMSTENTARKVRVKGYMERYSE